MSQSGKVVFFLGKNQRTQPLELGGSSNFQRSGYEGLSFSLDPDPPLTSILDPLDEATDHSVKIFVSGHDPFLVQIGRTETCAHQYWRRE